MAVKAVFFDIDGTLIDDNQMVRASTIKAINQLKSQGILVGLATGRGPSLLKSYMLALNLDVAIAYNGQYIFSCQEVLAAHPLSEADLLSVIDYAVKKKRDVSFGTATDIIGSSLMRIGTGNVVYRLAKLVPPFLTKWFSLLFNQIIRRLFPQSQEDLKAMLTEPIYQVMLLASREETQKFDRLFPHLTYTRSSSFAVDLISKGMSKLVGIKQVGEVYGFDLSQVVAFGDSDNDLEMLSGVGHGVAMGNGSQKVKAVARLVTKTNNQDGIYQALQKLGLIKEDKDEKQ